MSDYTCEVCNELCHTSDLRVIEIDFLFGSRRQEGQRLGRLFHGDEKEYSIKQNCFESKQSRGE